MIKHPLLSKESQIVEIFMDFVKSTEGNDGKLSETIKDQISKILDSRESCFDLLVVIVALIDKYCNNVRRVKKLLRIVLYSMKISDCFKYISRLFLDEFQTIFLICGNSIKSEERDKMFNLNKKIINEILRSDQICRFNINRNSKNFRTSKNEIRRFGSLQCTPLDFNQFMNSENGNISPLSQQMHLNPKSKTLNPKDMIQDEINIDLYDPFAAEKYLLADPIGSEKKKFKELTANKNVRSSMSTDIQCLHMHMSSDNSNFLPDQPPESDEMFEPIFGSIHPIESNEDFNPFNFTFNDEEYIDPIALVNDMFGDKENDEDLIDLSDTSDNDDFIGTIQKLHQKDEDLFQYMKDDPNVSNIKSGYKLYKKRPSSLDDITNSTESNEDLSKISKNPTDENPTHIHLVLENTRINETIAKKNVATIGRFQISRQSSQSANISESSNTPNLPQNAHDSSEFDSDRAINPINLQNFQITPSLVC